MYGKQVMWHDLRTFASNGCVFLQLSVAHGAVAALTSLYGTKYKYGPGAITICEYKESNICKKKV